MNKFSQYLVEYVFQYLVEYTFQIFNTIGAEVYASVESFDAGFSKKIDLAQLSGGEYFLRISKGKNTFTKTFVVAK